MIIVIIRAKISTLKHSQLRFELDDANDASEDGSSVNYTPSSRYELDGANDALERRYSVKPQAIGYLAQACEDQVKLAVVTGPPEEKPLNRKTISPKGLFGCPTRKSLGGSCRLRLIGQSRPAIKDYNSLCGIHANIMVSGSLTSRD